MPDRRRTAADLLSLLVSCMSDIVGPGGLEGMGVGRFGNWGGRFGNFRVWVGLVVVVVVTLTGRDGFGRLAGLLFTLVRLSVYKSKQVDFRIHYLGVLS